MNLSMCHERNRDRKVLYSCYEETFLTGKDPPIFKLGGKHCLSIDLNVLLSLGFADV